MTALMGLLGSGEFEPWTEEVDRWLLDRASGVGSVLILPLASAPEGDDVFDRWATMGLTHYESLGIAAEVLPLKTKTDTDRSDVAARLDTASVAYFSGGNPAYLAGALSGSRFWASLLQAMDRGMAYVGCSAGVACLGDVVPDSTVLDFTSPELWKPGLGLFPKLFLGPHWDALNAYVPGLQELFIAAVPPGHRLLAIDERTAVVGDGAEWQVMGNGGAALMEGGSWQTFRPGQGFEATFHATKQPSAPA
ncbi:MAG TPA: Type 1 glutamine amidotransferase-like domain-containing protein [Actinomycetota bacterium]|nr:Type 1 glutamine amidotransferase-like domain-containing protein [Actinomycetota bacterium]